MICEQRHIEIYSEHEYKERDHYDDDDDDERLWSIFSNPILATETHSLRKEDSVINLQKLQRMYTCYSNCYMYVIIL